MTADVKGLQGVSLRSLFPPPALVWDAAGDGNWADGEDVDSRWDGLGIGDIPDDKTEVTIRTDTVTVAASQGDQAAEALLIESGALVIDPGVGLAVDAATNVEAGAALLVSGTFGTNKLTVRTGWTAALDIRSSSLTVNDKEYAMSSVGPAAQELILEGGLENWVRNRLQEKK